MKRNIFAVLVVCTLGGCAARPFAGFEDARPEGYLSLRERSQCEVPDAPSDRMNWCDYPHEVRAFLDQRETCDYFRGEPWPEGDSADALARRKELTDAMKTSCSGTDKRLAELRVRYRGNEDINRVLAAFDSSVEP